jgi:pSer/pThr/pTyr-binding forkhead associated (FHA) protein
MKIRLSIAVGSGGPTTFEHAGPVIRIGRDPDCDLALQGEAADKVSRQHARIDLSAGGATLTDLGSSNGTLLNGGMLAGSAPLRVGDRIQLGFTGATLTVLQLDLDAPAVGKAVRVRPALLIGSVAAVALVIVVALLWPRKPEGPDEFALGPAPEARGPLPTEREKPPARVETGTDAGKQPPPPQLDQDKEVLARGPVHEAYAQPVSATGTAS